MYEEKIVDLTTNEIVIQDYDKGQMDEALAKQKKMADFLFEQDLIYKSKLAIFDKLGITEDEAKLLLS